MGTTTETRITSTQAKDAIYKAHSISSSASEIDNAVANHITQAELDSVVLGSGNITPEQAAIIASMPQNTNLIADLRSGYYFTTSNPKTLSASTGYEVGYFDVLAGETLLVSLGFHNAASFGVVAFFDKNGNVVGTTVGGSFNLVYADTPILVPATAVKVALSNMTSRGIALKCTRQGFSYLNAKVNNADELTDAQNSSINSIVVNTELTPTVLTGKYISTSTPTVVGTSAGYEIGYFNVVPYEELLISFGFSNNSSLAMMVWYDIEGNVLSVVSGLFNVSNTNTPFIAPKDAYKLAVINQLDRGITLKCIRQGLSAIKSPSQQSINDTSKLYSDTLKKDFDKFYDLASGNPSYNLDVETIGLIVAGQSNTDGRNDTSTFPAEYSKTLSNVFINKNNRNGVFNTMNETGLWAYDSIVHNKISTYLSGPNIYTVKRSLGGTAIKFNNSITNFNADISKFNFTSSLVSQIYELELAIRNAVKNNPSIKFKAILWHQGEADKGSLTYYRDLGRVIAYIRGVVGNPKLPFIFGTIPTISLAYDAKIKEDMQLLAQNVNDIYLVDMSDILLIDEYHFNADGSKYLGEAMFQIMLDNKMLKRG